MVYDVHGNVLRSVYDKSGVSLNQAYNLSGQKLLDESKLFNFMTFNVQNWSGQNSNQAAISAMFDLHKPLIVGLQECRSNGAYVPSKFPYAYGSTGITNPTRVFSTLAISDLTTTLYTTQGSETRGYQKFSIPIDGKTVTILNTHIEVLQQPNPHYAQLTEFLDILEGEETFIALGDFNLELHDKSSREYTDFVKPLIDAGYNLSNWSDDTGFVDTWFNKSSIAESDYKCPCDNIITSSDIEILEIVYDTSKIPEESTYPIDHIPVISTLRFKEASP